MRWKSSVQFVTYIDNDQQWRKSPTCWYGATTITHLIWQNLYRWSGHILSNQYMSFDLSIVWQNLHEESKQQTSEILYSLRIKHIVSRSSFLKANIQQRYTQLMPPEVPWVRVRLMLFEILFLSNHHLDEMVFFIIR